MDTAGRSAGDQVARLEAREAELEAELRRVRQNKSAWQAGQAGEEHVAAVLTQLPPGWRVLHDRRKGPRSPANIDHVVIGPTGVYVVDAKNWTGTLRIYDGGIACGRWPRNDELRAVQELAGMVSGELVAAGLPAPVFAMVALAHDGNITEPLFCEGVAFVPAAALPAMLTARRDVIDPERAYRIWEFLDDHHPPRSAAVPWQAHSPVAVRQVSPARRSNAPRRHGTRNSRKRGRPARAGALGLGGAFVSTLFGLAIVHALMTTPLALPRTPTTSPSTSASVMTSASAVSACELMPATLAEQILGHHVHRVALSHERCAYQTPGSSRPLAIVGYGRSLDSAGWSSWLTAVYGISSCGYVTVTSSGAGVGACVDTANGRTTAGAAWHFDDEVVARARARG